MVLKLSDYDYYLPEELIAQEPAEPRDSSRLMLVNRKTGEIDITIFREIKNYLKSGDVLVLNNTKVIPARLYGKKETGAKIEVLLLKKVGEGVYEALVKPGKRVKIGTKIYFSGDIYAEVIERNEEGVFVLRFSQEDLEKILPEIGNIPLPLILRSLLMILINIKRFMHKKRVLWQLQPLVYILLKSFYILYKRWGLRFCISLYTLDSEPLGQ